jgi:hypothetical protein
MELVSSARYSSSFEALSIRFFKLQKKLIIMSPPTSTYQAYMIYISYQNNISNNNNNKTHFKTLLPNIF